jgi:hypothetical protein
MCVKVDLYRRNLCSVQIFNSVHRSLDIISRISIHEASEIFTGHPSTISHFYIMADYEQRENAGNHTFWSRVGSITLICNTVVQKRKVLSENAFPSMQYKIKFMNKICKHPV